MKICGHFCLCSSLKDKYQVRDLQFYGVKLKRVNAIQMGVDIFSVRFSIVSKIIYNCTPGTKTVFNNT